MSLFNETFVNLFNTVDLENSHKHQNNEGNKTVSTDGSEDSVATYNEIDDFTKVGLFRKKHTNNLFFFHLNINSFRNLEPLIRNHFDIFFGQ